MSIQRKVPWVSLTLLLLTYGTWGWVISRAKYPPVVLVLAVIAIFILTSSLTTPWSTVANYSNKLFQSNLRSFSLAIFGAFMFFLMIAWFRVFIDTLVIISATILARIDVQTYGFKQQQSFFILFLISLTGLGFGVLINNYKVMCYFRQFHLLCR